MTRLSRASRRVAESWRAYLEPDPWASRFSNVTVTAVLFPFVVALTPFAFLWWLGERE